VTVAERRVGVMGGTFDPIHHGHLVAAEEARWQFGLDRVVFVPTGQPWQKAAGVSDAEDRYLMTVIATASNPAFSVSRLEIDSPGPTYTVDTLRRLRAEMDPDVRLFFVTGADAVLQILTWKDPDEVLALAELIAATRPGHDLADLADLAEKVPAAAGRVHPMRIPALAISSTEIRARVAAGAPIQYLVPEGVARYIEKRGLYREPAAFPAPSPSRPHPAPPARPSSTWCQRGSPATSRSAGCTASRPPSRLRPPRGRTPRPRRAGRRAAEAARDPGGRCECPLRPVP
jgi:nicotinate-nucleotide adenylyltransferase